MKILKFREFNNSVLNEEELPQLPDLSSMGEPGDPNATPAGGAPVASKKYTFVFISAEKDWAAEYPTGGGIKKYKRYQVDSADLDKWIESKNLTAKAEEIKNSLTGDTEMPKDLYFKFKQGLRDKELKYKELGELDVEYDIDLTPYTDMLDVTFLKAEGEEDKKKTEKPVEKTAEPEPNGNSEEIQ